MISQRAFMQEDTFADRLRRLLETRKQTASEIARQIGTTQQATSKWLKGGNIEYKNLRALADALQVDWLWLRYGDEALRDHGQPDATLMDQKRRQYIQEIMDTQERLRSALKVAQVATGELNPVTGEIRNCVNTEALFGRSLHHESDVFAVVHPDDLPRLKEDLAKITASPHPASCDYRILHPLSGETRWLVTRGQMFFDADGHPFKLLAVTIDITARKQAEHEAVQARRLMAQILDSIPDGCFTLDAGWRVTYLNFQAERLLQRSAEEILGRSLWETFPDALGGNFEKQYVRARQEGLAVHFDAFYAPLDAWFEVHAYPRDGGLVVYFRDITQIKSTEAAAARITDQLQLIEEVTGIGLLEFEDHDGALVLSPQAAVLFGIRPDEVIFRSELNQRVLEEDRPLLKRAIENAWRNKNAYESRYRIRLPDGSIRQLLEKGQVVINEQHMGGHMVAGILLLSS
jgi:PAS domain S-box-containing protein